MDKPKRIQRKRARGWNKPFLSVYVGRPTDFGNPFTIEDAIDTGFISKSTPLHEARRFVTECFRDWLTEAGRNGGRDWWQGPESDRRKAVIRARLKELRGKDLVCWCPLDHPCHADVLLEIANEEGSA